MGMAAKRLVSVDFEVFGLVQGKEIALWGWKGCRGAESGLMPEVAFLMPKRVVSVTHPPPTPCPYLGFYSNPDGTYSNLYLLSGVFFRKYTRNAAVDYDLVGWCLNTRQGTVKGQMQGAAENVEKM